MTDSYTDDDYAKQLDSSIAYILQVGNDPCRYCGNALGNQRCAVVYNSLQHEHHIHVLCSEACARAFGGVIPTTGNKAGKCCWCQGIVLTGSVHKAFVAHGTQPIFLKREYGAYSALIACCSGTCHSEMSVNLGPLPPKQLPVERNLTPPPSEEKMKRRKLPIPESDLCVGCSGAGKKNFQCDKCGNLCCGRECLRRHKFTEHRN